MHKKVGAVQQMNSKNQLMTKTSKTNYNEVFAKDIFAMQDDSEALRKNQQIILEKLRQINVKREINQKIQDKQLVLDKA